MRSTIVGMIDRCKIGTNRRDTILPIVDCESAYGMPALLPQRDLSRKGRPNRSVGTNPFWGVRLVTGFPNARM
jgi:hypothetical protein